MKSTLWCLTVVVGAVVGGCGGDDPAPMGNPVAINCGVKGGTGNELGIGKYCETTSDCPISNTGTAIQCSTALVDPSIPLMCSRLCDPAAADPGCGTNAVCHNLGEIGFDINACVPVACQPLFSEPLQ